MAESLPVRKYVPVWVMKRKNNPRQNGKPATISYTLQWVIYVLAATAWLTVLQRILHDLVRDLGAGLHAGILLGDSGPDLQHVVSAARIAARIACNLLQHIRRYLQLHLAEPALFISQRVAQEQFDLQAVLGAKEIARGDLATAMGASATTRIRVQPLNEVPTPSFDSTVISPPCASTSALETAQPRPRLSEKGEASAMK